MKKYTMPSYDEWRKSRYKIFNEKINHFSNHKEYEWLRKEANNAMNLNEGCGLNAIIAADFIERIEKASLEYIRDWLDKKNKLEWSGINVTHQI